MKINNLTKCFLFRLALRKTIDYYSEREINFLIGIFLMNKNAKRCSGNTLFTYLSKVYRTPDKKYMLSVLRKFKSEDLIRVLIKGPGTNIVLTEYGKQHLSDLEIALGNIMPQQSNPAGKKVTKREKNKIKRPLLFRY